MKENGLSRESLKVSVKNFEGRRSSVLRIIVLKINHTQLE
jgi:hypothetical protein